MGLKRLNASKVRAFDLFCGAGGSSCGAAQAGVEIAGGIDMWHRAVEAFGMNYPQAKVYRSRTDELSADSVKADVGPIDLLMASPECTNHSVAKGAAPRDEGSRRTAMEVIRFAEAWNPRWVVVENVVSMMKWHAYAEWKNGLQSLGYKIQELKLNSENFGVPQSRRRLIVVADREEEPNCPMPLSDSGPAVRKVLNLRVRTEKDGYSYRYRPLFGSGRAEATKARAGRAIEAVGDAKPFLLVYYGSDAAGGWQSIERPLRTITTLDRFALVKPNSDGDYEMRMLQPPELAAAMGFPPTYKWPKITRREHIKLIGNAVAPPVMRAVVKSLVS
jgi:DNA (cytosine-5)-methyltransferase 1